MKRKAMCKYVQMEASKATGRMTQNKEKKNGCEGADCSSRLNKATGTSVHVRHALRQGHLIDEALETARVLPLGREEIEH